MKIIYENKVTALGANVGEFQDLNLFVLFGENAPEELKDYCYSISVNPIKGTICPGQKLIVGENTYKITYVGEEVPVTLGSLGHCTVNFTGNKEEALPGSIYVEAGPMPSVQVGTELRIIEE